MVKQILPYDFPKPAAALLLTAALCACGHDTNLDIAATRPPPVPILRPAAVPPAARLFAAPPALATGVAAIARGFVGRVGVGDLLARALTHSDNTANDRLLRYIGGPAMVRAFLAHKNLGDIRFGPGERLLQAQTAGLTWQPEFAFGNAFARARARLPQSDRIAAFERYVADPPDGAAPRAIALALARLKLGLLLSRSSTDYLIGTMQSSLTGRQRLRGAVPPGWSFGHKTGTGQDLDGRTAGYNDVGLLTAPDGRSYAIAVMIGDTSKPIPDRQALMQAIVASVVVNHGG